MTSGLFIDMGAHFQNSEFKELARACRHAIYFFNQIVGSLQQVKGMLAVLEFSWHIFDTRSLKGSEK